MLMIMFIASAPWTLEPIGVGMWMLDLLLITVAEIELYTFIATRN